MVSNKTQHSLPPTQLHTLCIMYILYVLRHREGGGELNKREGWRGNSSQSWVENTNMTDCIVYTQSIYTNKQFRKVLLQVNILL
jgi:hypothetical protein